MPEFAYDVFLSYNSAQKDWTRDLARRLRDSGFNVWFDEWRLRGGKSWIMALEQGVEETEHLVFVVSPESVEADWPNFEQQIAILKDPAARFGKVIPVIYTHHPLPGRLKIRQCIDFSDTHDNPPLYEFKLAQLMADLDPSRERPIDFELWREQMEVEEPDVIPPVGPLPRGSVMPLRHNPHFVGREEELRKLEGLLRAGSTTAIGQVAAATGLGGIGKTQLAVEYTHRYGRRHPGGVFWVDMEDPEGIGSQVARCGGPEGMNLPGFDEISLRDRIARVKTEWESPTRRLLVFDNVVDPEVVEEWRPLTGGCRVLITSRRTDWPSGLGIQEVPLATLPRPKGIDLLCKGRPEALEDDEERAAADAICETLGDLPLAVALAGRYLEFYKHDLALAQYLEVLRAQPVLENPALVDFVKDPSPTKHIQNVGATFGLSYRRLDPEDETGLLDMRLFHLASHFAPVSIPRWLLVEAAGLDTEEEDDRRRATEGIRRLAGLGLIEEEAEGRLLLHRLLGEFARWQPPSGVSEEEGWEAVAETVASFATDENESGLPAALARELAHLRHLAAEADRRGWSRAGWLYNELGRHLLMVAAYTEARARFGRALAIDEAAYGPDHPNVARDVNNLGRVLKDMGDLKGAWEHYERALAIDEAAFGPDHPEVATDVNNLGRVLHDMGDLKGARTHYERALAIFEKVLGAQHPNVATLVNNLGGVLRAMGDLVEARADYERALRIDEAAFGPDHPNVARDVNNLGGVLQDMGDLEGAREHFERALAIVEKALGPGHPNVATAVNNLGSVLQHMGDLEGAREHFERALAIDEAALGPDHPDVATDVNNLGSVLKSMGDLEGAREHYERALAIDEAAFGPDHPNVATAVNNLGSVLLDMGDLEGAREHFERALAIWEKALGPEHPKVAVAVNNLGMVLRDMGDLEGARDHFQRTLAILQSLPGEPRANLAAAVNNLGLALHDMGDLEGARAHYERALRIDEAAFGRDHPKVAIRVNNLGSVLKDMGDLKGARAHFERALRIDEAAFGPDHPEVATRVNNLGHVLRRIGDLKGAREHYERALAIFEKVLGAEHPKVATPVNNLGSLLKDMGDLKGARGHLERALAIDEAAFGPDHPKVAIRMNNLGGVFRALRDLEGAREHYQQALSIDEAAFGPDHPDVARDVNNLGTVLHDMGDLEGARAHYERALAIFRQVYGEDHPDTQRVLGNLRALGKR